MDYRPHVFVPNKNPRYKRSCEVCCRVIDHPFHVQAVAFVPEAVIRCQHYQIEYGDRWAAEDARRSR
jgi:hypothetical protein